MNEVPVPGEVSVVLVAPSAPDGFWLVSQAGEAVTNLLDRERRGIAVHSDVIRLWNDTPEKTGRDCRAYYRRSEKTIYVLWGAV